MHDNFSQYTNGLVASYEKLMSSSPRPAEHRWARERIRGVYLFSEGNEHFYVGRTNHLSRRYGLHCRPSSQHNQAVFAFKLAREETGNIQRTYKSGAGSRKALPDDLIFSEAFRKAKLRVSAMDFRWVEEPHPIRQCLLEIYCAVVLNTPHNDFDNH